MLSLFSSWSRSLLDHALYHVVGRADDIVGDGAGRYLGIHDLIGLELFIHDLDAGLLLKFRSRTSGSMILAPVVDDDLAAVGSLGGQSCRIRQDREAHMDASKTDASTFFFIWYDLLLFCPPC